MSSTPVTTAPPAKVSWLKKFGQDVLKIITIGFVDAKPVVELGAQVIEGLDPALAPAIAAGEGIYEKIAAYALTVEATFAAAGQASNGPAKLNAVLAGVGTDIDAWVSANFPGSATIIKAETYLQSKAGLVNQVVSFLNSIDGNSVPTAITPQAVASAAAVRAALAAKAS